MKKALTLTSILFFCLPLAIFAASQNTYTPLVGIPGVNPNTNFDGYINALYTFSITIAALLAVIKIIIAGVKWMMTDVVTTKGEAKKDIQGALIGLLIVLAAVLILTVVNPETANVNLSFDKLQSHTYTPPAAATPAYTLSNGDVKTPLNNCVGENGCKAQCEQVDASKCGSFGQGDGWCYKGEFYNEQGLYTCVVRKNSNVRVSSEMDCVDTEACSTFNDSTCSLEGYPCGGVCKSSNWDCSAAKAACTGAGYTNITEKTKFWGGGKYITCS